MRGKTEANLFLNAFSTFSLTDVRNMLAIGKDSELDTLSSFGPRGDKPEERMECMCNKLWRQRRARRTTLQSEKYWQYPESKDSFRPLKAMGCTKAASRFIYCFFLPKQTTDRLVVMTWEI